MRQNFVKLTFEISLLPPVVSRMYLSIPSDRLQRLRAKYTTVDFLKQEKFGAVSGVREKA